MTTLDYERADQHEDGAQAYGEAHALLNRAHDVQVKLATLLDYALSATEARTPEACNALTTDAVGIARQIADMVGDWG
jgi:hypothetical protein